MIIKTVEELGPAFWNCLESFPLNKKQQSSPKDVGRCWREHNIQPLRDGSYGFRSEEEFTWFLLKWT
jgi:hypothetical protein